MPVSKKGKVDKGKKCPAVEKAMDLAMERFIAYQMETAERFFKWEEKQQENEEKAEERRRKEERARAKDAPNAGANDASLKANHWLPT